MVFLTRLWDHPRLTFQGLEYQAEVTADHSFEELTQEDLKEYAAIIAPAGYVSDYLLYAEKPKEISPACAFIQRIMQDKRIVKGFICHSLWIAGPIKESFAGRKVTCHNNIISHVENAGFSECENWWPSRAVCESNLGKSERMMERGKKCTRKQLCSEGSSGR